MMKRHIILILLIVSVLVICVDGKTTRRYHIPRSHIIHGEFKRAFNILLSYEEFNGMYQSEKMVENYDYCILMLIASYGSDEFQIAQKILNEVRKMNPRDPDLCYIQGRVLLKQGHPGKALDFFKLTLALHPDYRYAHYGQIESYLALKDPRKALAICNYCISALDGNQSCLYVLKARSLASMGKWKSAYRNMQYIFENSNLNSEIWKSREKFEYFLHKIRL